jgi:hypothetical protein
MSNTPSSNTPSLTSLVSRRAWAMLAALVLLSLPLAAQSDRSDQTVPLDFTKPHPLTTVAGPVKVKSLTMTNLGKGYARTVLGVRTSAAPSELTTTVRLVFDVENPVKEDWEVTFTVEFMDKAGKVVDRTSKKENYDDETAKMTFEQPLLEYVLPLISDVRITVIGRKK